MSELKPCPFCGTLPQTNTWTLHGISETRYFCPNPECPHSVRTVTLEEWQTRPLEDVLQSRIAELEKDNDEFRQLIHDWIIILTPDDGYVPDSECNDVATPIDVALRKRIAELEWKIDQLTAHDATERQDDKWIPVSERLPELYEKVIVFDEGGYMKVDFLCHMCGDFMYSDMNVTHWMPMPEPPEVQE